VTKITVNSDSLNYCHRLEYQGRLMYS